MLGFRFIIKNIRGFVFDPIYIYKKSLEPIIKMGVVKLIVPKFIHDRIFLAHNPHWKRNVFVALIQTFTFASVVASGAGKWYAEPPQSGREILDPTKTYFKPIRIL